MFNALTLTKKSLVTLCLLFLLFLFNNHPCLANTESKLALDKPEIQQFLHKMVHKHNFDKSQLEEWFEDVKIDPKIIAAISHPAESKPWYLYRPIFISDAQVDNGYDYWQKHKSALIRAEKKYGVPPEIIVSIIGVETRFGHNKGNFPALDALVTLGFAYPPRAKFFLKELEEFLILVSEEQLDPRTMKGSYAGALGIAQFMPSSYRYYAIDFSGNGQRDILNSDEDAIGSVANYFKMHGWRHGEPIIMRADIKGDAYHQIHTNKKNPKPMMTIGEFANYGITPRQNHEGEAELESQKAALIELENQNGKSYWLGLHNFYVITRYNNSDHYAMAVYELAQLIKKRMHEEG